MVYSIYSGLLLFPVLHYTTLNLLVCDDSDEYLLVSVFAPVPSPPDIFPLLVFASTAATHFLQIQNMFISTSWTSIPCRSFLTVVCFVGVFQIGKLMLSLPSGNAGIFHSTCGPDGLMPCISCPGVRFHHMQSFKYHVTRYHHIPFDADIIYILPDDCM
jgi:hypothetical protein